MILADFECQNGHITECLVDSSEETVNCPYCSEEARRIISFRSCYREDAPWLETVKEIVDKESTRPETRAFLAEPTRVNRERWMRAEGLRPMDAGEKAIRRDRVDIDKLAHKLMRRHYERKALVIR